MIDKSVQNNSKKKKNDTDFVDEVGKAFQNRPHIRKKVLIESLAHAHSDIVGYDEVTLEKKINDLCDNGILVRIEGKELEQYGIKESDRRATYLVFKETTEIKKHFDEVSKLLDSDKIDDIEVFLREVNSYNVMRYLLNDSQLDKLVEKLEIKNDKLRSDILHLISDHINRGVQPSDIGQIRDVLGRLLKEYPLETYKQYNMRGMIIELLGYYSNDIIIKQLTKDAEELNANYDNNLFNALTKTYSSQVLAEQIEKHRTELFNLQQKFSKEGKTNSVNFINNIRTNAIFNINNMSRTKQRPILRAS